MYCDVPTKIPEGHATLRKTWKMDSCPNDNFKNLNFTVLSLFPRRLKLEKFLENRLDFRPLFLKWAYALLQKRQTDPKKRPKST